MNEQLRPEEEITEYPERAESPTERALDMVSGLRNRAEDLGTVVQERARHLGEVTGERTREAVGQIVYFSEEARREAASRMGRISRFLRMQTDEVAERSRETVRQHPGASVGVAALAGIMFAWFGRRIMEAMGRR